MKTAEQIADEMMMVMFNEHLIKSDPDDKLLIKAVKKVVRPLILKVDSHALRTTA